MPRDLAAAIREAATSRTWVTPPAEPSTSALARVWTESTTRTSGDRASTCPSAVDRSVSEVR